MASGPQVSRRAALGMLAGGVVAGAAGARLGFQSSTEGEISGTQQSEQLTGDEAQAALKTYVAPGKFDEYFIFASGGHSGQILVMGVPSMRLLKVIPVFSKEPWSGYGFGGDAGEAVLETGYDEGKNNPIYWGDTHHPALSETEGEYDGRWLYINDRANGRIAMIDLKDFKTKQIFDVPNIQTSHGGCFVTPNSEYVHISTMTKMPWTDSG